jgi:hypothetical protein
MELASKSGLVRVTAFERQLAQRRPRVPEPVARAIDAQPGEILASGKAKYRPDSLIELERREASSRRELGNARGLIEMVVDIGERRRKRRRNRRRP